MTGQPPSIAVSSWSLHRAIGLTWWDSPAAPAEQKEAYGRGSIGILDLPATIARHGIDRLQVCHFHIASLDRVWLREFRAAVADAGLTFQSLLIDDGDISDPTAHARDVAWVAKWIDIAAELGAEAARVVAGKQKPSPETLQLSVAGLKELTRRGTGEGVRIVTENWFDLLSGPREVKHVRDEVGDNLGLLADFGNWKGPGKYDALREIMPLAEDTHAKCHFPTATDMDADDFGKCVEIAIGAGYAGPYTLIYDGPNDDEWWGIERERQFVVDRHAARQLQSA